MFQPVPGQHTSPSIETSTAVIREILDAWHADRPASRISPSAELLYGPAVFGHVAHVHRLADGVLTLYQAGQEFTAVTLIRQMIEATLRAVWLSVYRENLYHLIRDGERQRKNAFETAAKTGQIPADAPALKQAMEWLAENERIKEATSGESFETLCKEIEGGMSAYAQYRMASNLTHPGSYLLEHYLEAESRGEAEVHITFITKPELGAEHAWLSLATFMLILSGITWDHVDRARHHRALLRRHAVTYGVPTKEFEMTNLGFRNWVRAEKARKEATRRSGR